jgi:hypothetical protein
MTAPAKLAWRAEVLRNEARAAAAVNRDPNKIAINQADATMRQSPADLSAMPSSRAPSMSSGKPAPGFCCAAINSRSKAPKLIPRRVILSQRQRHRSFVGRTQTSPSRVCDIFLSTAARIRNPRDGGAATSVLDWRDRLVRHKCGACQAVWRAIAAAAAQGFVSVRAPQGAIAEFCEA